VKEFATTEWQRAARALGTAALVIATDPEARRILEACQRLCPELGPLAQSLE